MRKHAWKLTLGLGLLVGVGVLFYAPGKPDEHPGRAQLPDVSARTLRGELRPIASYAGQPLLLNVWATWCPPCLKEMPGLEHVHRDYREQGLRVVGISIDDAGAEDDIREFLREHKITFEILHDPTGRIMQRLAMQGVPETFLYSRSGKLIAHLYAADWDGARNRELIERLLRAD
jgi:cytochrome c biogenesis protein CcmG, thiol:disulfide interchange protein DsbE